MTLSPPSVLDQATLPADATTYTTPTFVTNVGSRILVFVVSGKAANLSENPTTVSHQAMGNLVKIQDQAIPNNNLRLSVWTGVGSGTGTLTITHAIPMDNCLYQVVELTSDLGTPRVLQTAKYSGAATGVQTVDVGNTPLPGSCVLATMGYNSGSANTPTLDANFTSLGLRLTQTSPTVQLMSEYNRTSPSDKASFSLPVAAGTAIIAMEVADVGPSVPNEGTTDRYYMWLGGETVVLPYGSVWTQPNGTRNGLKKDKRANEPELDQGRLDTWTSNPDYADIGSQYQYRDAFPPGPIAGRFKYVCRTVKNDTGGSVTPYIRMAVYSPTAALRGVLFEGTPSGGAPGTVRQTRVWTGDFSEGVEAEAGDIFVFERGFKMDGTFQYASGANIAIRDSLTVPDLPDAIGSTAEGNPWLDITYFDPEPTSNASIWDGTAEIPVMVTLWNGAAEVPLTFEIST